MISVAVLITVFNRIEKTELSLEKLFSSFGNKELYLLDVYLVDDGSTDNTREIISIKYPQVNILEGNGQLYWNRGMYYAWKIASEKKDYDAYLWLNNDTFIYPDGLLKLINAADKSDWKALICGSIESPDKIGEITYGGRLLKGKKYELVLPNENFVKVDAINGNIVLVPKFVFDTVGNLDKKFTHAIGDFDYGLRANKKGISVIAIGFVGACCKNNSIPAWCIPGRPLVHRIKNLYHPLGRSEPHKFFYYSLRHFGLIPAVKTFLSQHVRLLFPSLMR